jgi:hypothetical protein
MHISPVGYAKLFGLAATITLIALLVVWSRAHYKIEGVIAVEGQPTPASLEVRLMAISADDDIAMLTNELVATQQALTQTIVTQLGARVTAARAAARAKRALDITSLDVSRHADKSAGETGPLTPAEEAELAARMERYTTYALYCREQMKTCRMGGAFYEHGARFWDDKVAQLRSSGRLAADEATRAYETEWLDHQGLGEEPSQRVRAFVSSNAVFLALHKETQTKPAPMKKERAPAKTVKEGGLIAGCAITTNDVMTLVDEAVRTLQHQHTDGLPRAEESMLNATLAIAHTDGDGRFTFAGGSIQPGRYIVFARMEALSLDGERMEYMWYEPVYVPLKRLAFNKRATVRLTELNTRKPAVLQAAVPTRDELFATILTDLRSSAP